MWLEVLLRVLLSILESTGGDRTLGFFKDLESTDIRCESLMFETLHPGEGVQSIEHPLHRATRNGRGPIDCCVDDYKAPWYASRPD